MALSLLACLLLVLSLAFVSAELKPESALRLALRFTHWVLGLREHSVRVHGLRIVYLEAGRGEPLLLLHGMGADKENFLRIAAPLAKRYRVILPDLPGFGDSDKPADRSYAVADQVRYLHAFAASLALETFDLGGNSMGGLIAGAYAAAHPEKVTSLWLLAPAGVKAAAPSELMRALEAGSAPPILGRNAEDVRQIIRFVTHKPPPLPRFLIRAMALQQKRQYEFNTRVIQQLVDGPGLDELLAEAVLRTPTLIVWGEQDRALDVSGAEVLHRLLPRSQVRRMRGVGHVPQLEAPGAIVRDYLAFRQQQA